MWSLGVMAFELLTGKPSLRVVEGTDKVLIPQCKVHQIVRCSFSKPSNSTENVIDHTVHASKVARSMGGAHVFFSK